MPVIKSAKKKLRQDKKATLRRFKVETALKDAVKKATTTPTAKNLSAAASLLDKAAKIHIVHRNKAARVKSRLAHLLSPKKVDVQPKVEKKVVEKKTPAKKTPAKTKKSK